MSHQQAKYDFYPGCLAVVISAGIMDKHLLGRILTCIKPVKPPQGKVFSQFTSNVWEVTEEFTWYHVNSNTLFKRNEVSQHRLMPLPPPDGIILSEEELLLICQN